ncbi:porin family protein [Sphingomonas sp.]|uniref:outer membrane protein n=1 Tax=Sphingomonas sp. TaxID=28214 RepID=UPI0031E38A95
MKKIALALVALTAAATPAFAQDEAAPFTGGHITAIVGYDMLDLNTSGLDNPNGLTYGAALGYDYQSGNVLFGVEGEVIGSTAKIEAGNTTVARAGRDLYAGGRIGYVFGRTAVYGKVGYANARVETIAGDENGDGIRFGGGVEHKFTDKLFVKGEYRYTNYEADVERHQVVAGVGVRF